MKTSINLDIKDNKSAYAPYFINKSDVNVKLLYWEEKNNVLFLQFKFKNIDKDNYRIFINGHYLSLILSEEREFSKPVYVHNMAWSEHKANGYEIMKCIDFWLPGDNFYLARHYLIPEDNILQIFLGKIHFN